MVVESFSPGKLNATSHCSLLFVTSLLMFFRTPSTRVSLLLPCLCAGTAGKCFHHTCGSLGCSRSSRHCHWCRALSIRQVEGPQLSFENCCCNVKCCGCPQRIYPYKNVFTTPVEVWDAVDPPGIVTGVGHSEKTVDLIVLIWVYPFKSFEDTHNT